MVGSLQQREALRDWAVSQPFSWALTAALNDFDATDASIERAIRGLHARIDRRLLGRNWSKAPADQRSLGLWFPEKAAYLHAHGLLGPVPDTVIEELPDMWQKICPSGNLDIQLMTSAAGWMDYSTKSGTGFWLFPTA